MPRWAWTKDLIDYGSGIHKSDICFLISVLHLMRKPHEGPFRSVCLLCGSGLGSRRAQLNHTLQWRHYWRDCVSDHQPHNCLLKRLFWRRSEKTSKFCVTGPCAGNSPVTGEFPAQMASYAENVSIWWRHHDSFDVYFAAPRNTLMAYGSHKYTGKYACICTIPGT